ncbi:MAG: CoA pyrophosphatase [Proteobacteria bacterium]|nr:CoA pyrophosphatase [Pseudomonadota bacterium]
MPVALDLASIRRRLASRKAVPARPATAQRAAVAAVLRSGASDAEVLLIRRAEVSGDPWSGHMAFPGGRAEPEDASLIATATRETREEVGLALNRHAELLGWLDELPAVAGGRRTGMLITPYVFALDGQPNLQLGPEVAEIVWAPLGPLAGGQADTTRSYRAGGRSVSLPAFAVQDHVVWGLTYRMLQSLLKLLQATVP